MDLFDHQMDEALRDIPLHPLPDGFTRRVISQVRGLSNQTHPRPQFRLEFVDVSVPAFVAFFLTALASAGLWLWRAVDPLLAAKSQIWLRYIWMQATALPVFPLALVGLVGVGFLVLGVLCYWILMMSGQRRYQI
jgi:hypothetical protein